MSSDALHYATPPALLSTNSCRSNPPGGGEGTVNWSGYELVHSDAAFVQASSPAIVKR